MQEFNTMIQEISEELQLKVTFLSEQWLKVLEKNGMVRYIVGYKFSLNDHGLGNVVDDKGLFYDVLTSQNLPIIEHKVIFQDYDKNEVLDYFHSHHNEIVLKGNLGTCGTAVFLVKNESELQNMLDKLFQSQYSVSLCPYYDIINEYRVIVLNQEVRLIYGKSRPKIIGNGINTIKELAIDFNPKFEEIPLENANYIPKVNEEILINFQFNLSRGAKMFLEIEENLKEALSKLALEVTRKTNLRFGSVDIIKTSDNRLLVMEANSGVMMDNYVRQDKINGRCIAYEIYRDAIKSMFDNQC